MLTYLTVTGLSLACVPTHATPNPRSLYVALQRRSLAVSRHALSAMSDDNVNQQNDVFDNVKYVDDVEKFFQNRDNEFAATQILQVLLHPDTVEDVFHPIGVSSVIRLSSTLVMRLTGMDSVLLSQTAQILGRLYGEVTKWKDTNTDGATEQLHRIFDSAPPGLKALWQARTNQQASTKTSVASSEATAAPSAATTAGEDNDAGSAATSQPQDQEGEDEEDDDELLEAAAAIDHPLPTEVLERLQLVSTFSGIPKTQLEETIRLNIALQKQRHLNTMAALDQVTTSTVDKMLPKLTGQSPTTFGIAERKYPKKKAHRIMALTILACVTAAGMPERRRKELFRNPTPREALEAAQATEEPQPRADTSDEESDKDEQPTASHKREKARHSKGKPPKGAGKRPASSNKGKKTEAKRPYHGKKQR